MNYNKIKAKLAEKNRRSNDLVKLLGKDKTTISLYCTNKVQPPMSALYRIADYLVCDPSELLITLEEYRDLKEKK